MINKLFSLEGFLVIPDPSSQMDYLNILSLMRAFNLSVNDAIILYLLQSRKIGYLSTFDKKLADCALRLGVGLINK